MKGHGETPPEELTRLQAWFQAVVTNPAGVQVGVSSDEARGNLVVEPGTLEQIITRSRALTAVQRLSIYANAYHSRLLECLAEVFPMLQRTLGAEAFDELGFAYLQDYPSRTYTLNELGRHFPGFLQQSRPTAESLQLEAGAASDETGLTTSWPDFLIDLAQLEWAIYEVFDGPGIEGKQRLDAEALGGIAAEVWPHVKLKPAACLRLLQTRFPVNDYYTEMRKAKPGEVVAIPPSGASFVALTRRDFIVRRYPLLRAQFQLLGAIQENKSIGEAIALIASGVEVDVEQLAGELQRWFAGWTANGFFESIDAPDHTALAGEENV